MIRFDRVTVRYRTGGASEVTALDDVSLEVEQAETLCLIGGSGSGKTTCLRLINRLQEPTSGRVTLRGDDVAGLEPIGLRRSMGYVIQSGGLFPHLTVSENIGLLGRLENRNAREVERRVRELLELVRLPFDDYADRYPTELSGGEVQRVGIARALSLDPPVVLMDEPFGALDPITREHLQREFLEWKRAVGKTIVLVSHDLREAFRLADRVALLREGRLVQLGTEADLRERPTSAHVEEFLAAEHHA